jgi:hypothetical protein
MRWVCVLGLQPLRVWSLCPNGCCRSLSRVVGGTRSPSLSDGDRGLFLGSGEDGSDGMKEGDANQPFKRSPLRSAA